MEINFDEPVKLSTPIDVVHKFVGGSMDGQVHTGKAYYKLTDKSVLTLNDEMYAFDGQDTYTFTGVTSRLKERKETLKEKIVKWLLT